MAIDIPDSEVPQGNQDARATQTTLLEPSKSKNIKSLPSVTTSELTHKLFSKYGTSEDAVTQPYIVATQVRPSPTSGDSTADAVVIGNWPSKGYEVQGFEIKVSRSDWLNEVKDPTKCDPTKKYCNRWWLLMANESMVKPEELPDDWGMMVNHGKGLRIVKEAPVLTPQPLTVQFMTGLMRANKRSQISEDLHNQYIQDNNRKIEAKLKAEFADLKQFVKFIKEAFGVELTQEKSWSMETHDYAKEWTAKVRNKYNKLDAAELKQLLEASISGDLTQVKKEMRAAYDEIQSAVAILEKYKGVERW